MRHASGRVAQDDAQRQPVQRLGKTPVALRPASFGLAAARDIANKAGEPLALVEFDLADGELDRKNRAVLAFRRDLTANSNDSPLPGAKIPRQIPVMLGCIGFRHQIGDIPANDIPCGIAKQLLRRSVEGFDDSGAVYRDDGIGRSGDDHLQQGAIAAQRRLGCDLVGNVDARANHIFDRAVGSPGYRVGPGDPAALAIFGDPIVDEGIQGLPSDQRLEDRPYRVRLIGRNEQVPDILADSLRAGVSAHAFARCIERDDASARIENDQKRPNYIDHFVQGQPRDDTFMRHASILPIPRPSAISKKVDAFSDPVGLMQISAVRDRLLKNVKFKPN